jgi:ATP-dependent DNA helicase DinG
MTDRGVVAVLDPRMVNKRYGRTLVDSLPPMFRMTSPDRVRAALERLAAARTEATSAATPAAGSSAAGSAAAGE